MIINSRHSFYTSDLWAKCKQQVYDNKKDENGVVHCEICGKPLIKAFNPKTNDNRSTIVYHHTIELTDTNYMDYNISLNPELIQTLCFKCHNKVHNRFGGGSKYKAERKVYIVHGSPLSGKTSFVKENSNVGDLIYDFDDIYQVLSGQPRYERPNTIKPIVFAVRDTILEQIKMRSGQWDNAWIIMTEPFSLQRKRVAEQLNAELIHIETTKEICLERLTADPNGRDVQTWKKAITDYFDKFTE